MKVYEGKIADDYRNKFVQSFLKGGVCFVAGTLVLTETRQEPIETITEGEAEIVEAAAQGAEIATELNGQELTPLWPMRRRIWKQPSPEPASAARRW